MRIARGPMDFGMRITAISRLSVGDTGVSPGLSSFHPSDLIWSTSTWDVVEDKRRSALLVDYDLKVAASNETDRLRRFPSCIFIALRLFDQKG